MDVDVDKINYVLRYYSHLMTEQEKLANRHLFGTMKATQGRSDVEAQNRAKERFDNVEHFRKLLSDDPDVLFLAREGHEAFALWAGRRILADHREQIVFNFCPQCGAVARTPTARQCRYCRHDWHNK